MRIVQIGNYPQDENRIRGGIQSSLFGLVNELQKKSNYVYAIALPNRSNKKDYSEERNNLKVSYFSNKAGYNVLGITRFFSITSKIKNFKPDVCHIHGGDLLVLLIYIYCRIKKIPV